MNLRALYVPMAPLCVASAAGAMAWFGAVQDETLAEKPAIVGAGSADVVEATILTPSAQDQNALVEIVQLRPLLAQNRRVPEPISQPTTQEILPEVVVEDVIEPVPEPVIESPSPLPPELNVLGIMIESGQMHVLVRNREDQTEKWFVTGEEISGWTLVEITQDAMLLRQNQAETTIKMFE